jgi:hypothetical protein
MDRPSAWLTGRVGSRHAALLVTLLAMLAVYPFLGEHRGARWVIDLVTLGVFVAAISAVVDTPRRRVVAWTLGVPAVAISALSRSFAVVWAAPFADCARTLFFGFLIVIIFTDILRRREVATDAILGACNVYILLGIAWGSLYALLEWASPGAFSNSAAGQPLNEFDLVYFSLVDLTSIGFGDIVPVSPQARGLAALQGLVGQLYLAIIIARLVGLDIANRVNRGANVAE